MTEELCEGCQDQPAEIGNRFCAECAREIELDYRTSDPADSHGRNQ